MGLSQRIVGRIRYRPRGTRLSKGARCDGVWDETGRGKAKKRLIFKDGRKEPYKTRIFMND